MARYSFATDPDTATEAVKRIIALRQTVTMLHDLIRYEKPGKTGTFTLYSKLPPSMRDVTTLKVTLDPEAIDDLISQLRGEVEALAESFGHILDRSV